MAALKSYFPSKGEDQDAVMKHLWDQGATSHLMFVQRMSLRGNPHIKGVFIPNHEDATTPSELECVPLSKDHVRPSVNEFREELSMTNNGVELGSLN